MSKIQKDHLDRAAFVYVRQSSAAQVEQNLESQAGGDNMAWWNAPRPSVGVTSGSSTTILGVQAAGALSGGFEKLLSEVCQGQAGAVFAIEASRLV